MVKCLRKSLVFKVKYPIKDNLLVPASNGQCVVGVNHELVFGVFKGGWTHRKPSHQTYRKRRASA